MANRHWVRPCNLGKETGMIVHQLGRPHHLSRVQSLQRRAQVYPEGSRDFPSWSCTCIENLEEEMGQHILESLIPSQSDRGGSPGSLPHPATPPLPQTCLPEQSQQPRPRLLARLAGPLVPGVGTQQTTADPRQQALCSTHYVRKLRHRGHSICPGPHVSWQNWPLNPEAWLQSWFTSLLCEAQK